MRTRAMHRLHGIRQKRGLSIVEVLISLSISAMLLTAVASAFSASSQIIETNDEFFRASQSARVSMNQILTEVRRCHAMTVDSSNISLITFDNDDRTYRYDSSAKQLRLVTNDITTDPDYVLANNVVAASFSADTEAGEGGVQRVVRVSVTLVVDVGGNQVRLTGSAAPRRVQNWNN